MTTSGVAPVFHIFYTNTTNSMRNVFGILATTALFTAGTLFTGCQTAEKKVENAQEKMQDAKQDLKEAQKDASVEARRVANAEAYKTMHDETNIKIKENEVRIEELRMKMKRPGKTLDAVYEARIASLEQRNRDLKTRIDGYDVNTTSGDWEAWKREFNRDMDSLGNSLRDFTMDNKR
jgi:chromosome segregation ATPase